MHIRKSLIFFLWICLIIASADVFIMHNSNLFYLFQASISISYIMTIAFILFRKKGRNFFTAIIGTVLVYIFIYKHDPFQLHYLSAGLLLGSIIGILSYKLNFLTSSGSAATILLAGFIFGFGGWKWTIPILGFFIISSVLSKVRSAKNKEVDNLFEKTGTRDHIQVFSNGALGGILVLLNYFLNSDIYFVIYAATVAAVCADTWGTEIGTMYRTKTYNILNFKKVQQGTSGAISVPGTAGTLAGAFFISFISVLWISFSFIPYFLIIFFSGIAGAFIDSILGAAFQACYRCSVCGTNTEKRIHCSSPSLLEKGFTWLNNDLVNIIAATCGGIFSVIFLYIFL